MPVMPDGSSSNSAAGDGADSARTVIVLVAHGSRNPAAGRDHIRLCGAVADRSGLEVRPAYLEIDEPSVPDAVDAAVADGALRIRLVPLFLHAGNHTRRDLPAIAEAARVRHPKVAVELDEHVGADPALADLVASRLNR